MESTEMNKIRHLQELKASEGWQIIVEVMNNDIAKIERKLFGEVPMEKGETIKKLQDQRDDRKGLRDIVDNLISVHSDKPVIQEELDPYDKTIPHIKK